MNYNNLLQCCNLVLFCCIFLKGLGVSMVLLVMELLMLMVMVKFLEQCFKRMIVFYLFNGVRMQCYILVIVGKNYVMMFILKFFEKVCDKFLVILGLVYYQVSVFGVLLVGYGCSCLVFLIGVYVKVIEGVDI